MSSIQSYGGLPKHNFSKIGKYISNKLHHYAHSEKKQKKTEPEDMGCFVMMKKQSNNLIQSARVSEKKNNSSKTQLLACTDREKIKNQKLKKIKQRDRMQPSVGHYNVNYSTVDRNVKQYNFNRSTPHFHKQKYHINEITTCYKQYPEGITEKMKGFKRLQMMTGRQDIKGNIRKNLENPHQNRFILCEKNGTQNNSPVNFKKMMERPNIVTTFKQTQAEYQYDHQIVKKKLASQLIAFQKQSDRKGTFNTKASPNSELYYNQEKDENCKIVPWSRQISRQKEGMVPSYMEKNVNSRLAMSMQNFKALEMNCYDFKIKIKNSKRKRRDEEPRKDTKEEKQNIY